MLIGLGFATALPFLVCAALFLWMRPRGSFALRLARAIGVCTLFVAPAILAQDLMLYFGWSYSRFGLVDCLSSWPFQVWVLLGGGVVQQVFEVSAKALSGHRQSTMLDNWPIYYAFTLAWVLPWSTLLAARMRAQPLRNDPLAWCVAVVLLAHALAGVRWPWWGT